jgi:hypothetical protein
MDAHWRQRWPTLSQFQKLPGLYDNSAVTRPHVSCYIEWGLPLGLQAVQFVWRHTIKAGHIDIPGDTASHGSNHLWSTWSHLLSVSVHTDSVHADSVHCMFTHAFASAIHLSHTVFIATACCPGLSGYNRGCTFHKSLVSGYVCLLRKGPTHVAQVCLQLMLLLPQLPKCWDYRNGPPHPAGMKLSENLYKVVAEENQSQFDFSWLIVWMKVYTAHLVIELRVLQKLSTHSTTDLIFYNPSWSGTFCTDRLASNSQSSWLSL